MPCGNIYEQAGLAFHRQETKSNTAEANAEKFWLGGSMNWKNDRIKRYMEIGMAVLIVLTLGLAGATGVLSTRAEENGGVSEERTESSEGSAGEEPADEDLSGAGDSESDGGASESGISEVSADGQYPIMGESSVTVQEMVDYFNSSGEEYPAEELSAGGADSIETFCQMYYDEAEAEGVRAEVAFAQTMKETGFLQYGGDASIEQFNFAGLGTTGGGVPGNSYPDVRTGIRAQIQHLKAYATTDSLEQKCVDERYEYVKKGSAPYVEWLGQQENPDGTGWATADNYGYDIVGMIEDMQED